MMREFLISPRELPLGWKRKFSEDEFKSYIHGDLIAQPFLKSYLARLDKSVKKQEYISNNLTKLFLTSEKTNTEVYMGSWNGYNHEKFIELTSRILSPILCRNITLYVPHGSTSNIVNDGNFHVHIWSSLINQLGSEPPWYIDNILVPCRNYSMITSSKGQKILSDDLLYTIGEVTDDDLFIHHDICHTGKSCELELYEHILNKVCCLLRI